MTMFLPEYIQTCIRMLEEAGFAAYAVGGCVRDALLGLEPHDYDLCTDARPDGIRRVFAGFRQILAGEKHGTVTVLIEDNPVEITTFRTEGAYTDSRHPQWVEFVPEIEKDLARRDFTVNAMAYSPTRGFADPFGGQQDLKDRVLRAVGDPTARFTEDALRILRGVRFAVRFGLGVEEATLEAMKAQAFRMDHLSRERVFDELCKLLPLVSAEDLLRYRQIITQVIPELQPLWGFDQKNRHHIYDVYTHTAHVVAAVPADLTLRWAALLHDLGKPASFSPDSDGQGHFYGHAAISAELANEILHRLKAPTALRERVVLLIEKHMVWLEVTKPAIRRWISRLGIEAMQQLMILQEADTGGKGTENPKDNPYFSGIAALIREILAEDACLQIKDLAVNGHDLMALGLSGKAIGQMLNRLLELVLDEEIQNEKAALLARVQEEIQ